MPSLPRHLSLLPLYLLLATPAIPQAAPLITEFMSANSSVIYDEDAQSSDWIEIHNPEPNAIDLDGYFLTDDPEEPDKWRFPEITLPAGGYLIVFASDKNRKAGELHTNFRLSNDPGGYLALTDPDGQTFISGFTDYPEQFDDISYGLTQSGGNTTSVLVREGDACKLLVPTADIGTAWQNIQFDDSNWEDATTGIGYERSSGYENLIGAGGDVENQTYDINSTVYVRIPFNLDSVDGISGLKFRMKYDDGFIAYLNGTEIASGNKPANPAWNSDASNDHPDSQATSFVDTDLSSRAAELLIAGNNILSIHSMNGDTRSSDLLALPRLEGEFFSAPGQIGSPGYFQEPSPGNANGTEQGLPSGRVSFSQPGRGFTGSLSVSLSSPSPAAQLRYTTNGDVPTANSSLFNGNPINISSSTLLRARAFEPGLTPGPVSEEGYIRLSSNARTFSSDLPVIIMERFNGGPSASNGKAFTFFAFFEPDPANGRTTLNRPYNLGTRGGWKVRGSSSSGFSKKAFSIEAWNEFNRNKDISPLGLPEESDWILNARSVFDRSLMRNAFIYELSNQVGRYAVRTRFVELFKDDNGGDLNYNNDYDGVYTFMEKISRDKERVDVERLPQSINDEPGIAGGYMMKIDRLDPGDSGLSAGGRTLGWVYPKEDDVTSAQSSWLRNYINEMNAALSTPQYRDYIDVGSWVDHHLLNVLTLNADALRLSTYFFKGRQGKVEFGPIWDFDRSMESTDNRDNNPSTWAGGTNYFTYPWWATLFNNENFWQAYIDRYFELRDGVFATANVHAIIDGMAAELNEAQVRNFQRWSDQPRFGSYQGEVNHLKDWLATRLNWMDGQFAPRPSSNRPEGIYPPGTRVSLSASLGANQKIYYTLDGRDPRPTSETNAIEGTTLVGESINVRALVPGSDIGSQWRTDPDFNDSSWLSGRNGIGYERGNGYEPYINIDVNTQMEGRTSCYVRIKFNVNAEDLAGWNFMNLQARCDDGFVAYLNGTEIVRDLAPANLSWNSSAIQTTDDAIATTFQNFEASNFFNLLQPGENLLAIHALNESTTSSDFLNQVKLVAGFDEGAGEGGTGGIEYTGPITLNETTRLFARVFDSDGGNSTGSGRTPVGTGWSAPLQVEYLVNETPASTANLAVVEIMNNPHDLGDDLTEDGEFEWIELQNVAAQTISLTGVSFSEGIQFQFPGRSLDPGERVIVVRSLEAFQQVYGTGRNQQIAGTYSGALENNGETLVLTAADGNTIQNISYPGNIAPKGYSLILAGDNAWQASRSLLGSPGAPEPTPDQVPDIFVTEILTNSIIPQLDVIEIHNPNTSAVDISGWLLTDNLGQPDKFRIPDDTILEAGGYLTFDENEFTGFALDSFGEEIFLVASTPSGERRDYVDGFSFGDASAGVTFGRHITSAGEVHYVPMATETLGAPNAEPLAGPLVISELMYNPAAGGSEFIEIKNISSSTVSLSGVEISGCGFIFPADTADLNAGGLILLVSGDPAEFRDLHNIAGNVPIFGPYPGRLDNGGEKIRIKVPESSGVAGEPELLVSVDITDYEDNLPWPAEADGNGFSLQRVWPAGYGGEPLSWELSSEEGGNPGVDGAAEFDWRTLFFSAAEIATPSISGPLADADNDGVANVLEYLLATDPRNPGSSRPLGISAVGLAGERRLEITLTIRNQASGFTARIESSETLGEWNQSAGQLTLLSTTQNDNGTTTLVYRSNELNNPPDTKNLFYRVRAVETP
ncbi:MAG: CotH kinase family protein [Verrucomicrobiota bacterium]|nr:CotH kinase family protein [Verrucomicrobiota bacterium]